MGKPVQRCCLLSSAQIAFSRLGVVSIENKTKHHCMECKGICVWGGFLCCVLLTHTGFQPCSKAHRNGSRCCCVNCAARDRSGAVACWQEHVGFSSAAYSVWAWNNGQCWAFLAGEVGHIRGNCDCAKHNVGLLQGSLVHSLGSICRQQLPVSNSSCT